MIDAIPRDPDPKLKVSFEDGIILPPNTEVQSAIRLTYNWTRTQHRLTGDEDFLQENADGDRKGDSSLGLTVSGVILCRTNETVSDYHLNQNGNDRLYKNVQIWDGDKEIHSHHLPEVEDFEMNELKKSVSKAANYGESPIEKETQSVPVKIPYHALLLEGNLSVNATSLILPIKKNENFKKFGKMLPIHLFYW